MISRLCYEPPFPYDGRHLLVDLYGCPVADDPAPIETALRAAAERAGATVIGMHLHHFGEGHGVTGGALPAESTMSIHNWPEHGYAAIDIFLCGAGRDPEAALQALADRLAPARIVRTLVRRGEPQ